MSKATVSISERDHYGLLYFDRSDDLDESVHKAIELYAWTKGKITAGYTICAVKDLPDRVELVQVNLEEW